MMLRAFFAIPMPQAIRDTLTECRELCTAADPSWAGEKWVAPENLHVTLRFLGSITEPEAALCVEDVTRALATSMTYRLRLSLVHAIPRRRSASLIWVAPSLGKDETASLADTITRVTASTGLPPDERRFRPHVSLCRARTPRPLAPEVVHSMERLLATTNESAISMSVRGVTLLTSELTPRGPEYKELAKIPFDS